MNSLSRITPEREEPFYAFLGFGFWCIIALSLCRQNPNPFHDFLSLLLKKVVQTLSFLKPPSRNQSPCHVLIGLHKKLHQLQLFDQPTFALTSFANRSKVAKANLPISKDFANRKVCVRRQPDHSETRSASEPQSGE